MTTEPLPGMPPASKAELVARLTRIFTPATPVQDKDLFAGRLDQVLSVLSALNQPGIQVVIYGERGVGKSSLANVLSQFAHVEGQQVRSPIRVNCSTGDSFKSIWTRIFKESGTEIPDDWAYGSPDPDEIRIMLERAPFPFVILDEFDRWDDDDGLTAMADTVKALSDHATTTKIVIVGVADSIDQLIGEHDSVRRAIEEVLLPRMSKDELEDIPKQGLARIGVEIDPQASASIARLSEGLPHFTHLLSLHAGQRCIIDDRFRVVLDDVISAIRPAVVRHSVLHDYQKAVAAQRKDTLHSRVLLACALAEKDALGFFSASDVRGPMSAIMGKPYAIPAFAPHLGAFAEPDRGPVLKREGRKRRYRYRFLDPRLQPFTVLTALSEGWLPESYRTEIFSQQI